jgi:predicted nucleic acid-binding protein
VTRFLVDTGAWYALADRKDPDHASVGECLRERSGRLVTTNFIFDESVTLIRFRLGSTPARTFGEQLLRGGAARLVGITRRDEARAWEIFTRYRDKSFSYTDCTSFAIMQRLGIGTAIAIDEDFRSFGLACLP